MIPKSGTRFSEKIMPKHKSDGSDPAKLDQTLWQKPFKDHLIRVAGGAFTLLLSAHGPGQERQAENVARDPWRGRRQLIYPIGDKMRPGAERVAEMQHALALGGCRLGPVGFLVGPFGNDTAGKRRHRLAQRQHLIRVE